MKITVGQLEDLYLEKGDLTIDGKAIEVVEEDGWEQDHKFQTLELIITDGEKYYRGYISRSGSPFTDWTYDSEIYGGDAPLELVEVEKKEVTITEWVPKGDR